MNRLYKLIQKLGVSLAILVFAGILGSDVGEAQRKTRITFWHHEAPEHRVAAFQRAIDLFQKENPDIEVVQEVVMWADAWPKTLAAIAAGNPPDFEFAIPELTITIWKAGGSIPVTDIVKEIDAEYGYIPSQLAPYYHNGEYWGVPIWTMPMVLLYRPSYLEQYVGVKEPPRTWDELLAYARKQTVDTSGDGRIDIYGIGLAAANNLLTQEQAYNFLAQVDALFFDDKGKVVFDSPATRRAVQYYKDLFQFSPPAAVGWGWGEMELNYAAGKLAMSPYFGALQKRFYDVGSRDLDAALMPYPQDGRPGALIYPNDITVFKQARESGHYEAVKKFIKFIMRPDINAIITAQQEPGAFVPLTRAAMESPAYWEDPIIRAFPNLNRVLVDTIPIGRLYGFEFGYWANPGIAEVSGANVLAEVIQKAITGAMTVEQAVSWGARTMREFAGQ